MRCPSIVRMTSVVITLVAWIAAASSVTARDIKVAIPAPWSVVPDVRAGERGVYAAALVAASPPAHGVLVYREGVTKIATIPRAITRIDIAPGGAAVLVEAGAASGPSWIAVFEIDGRVRWQRAIDGHDAAFSAKGQIVSVVTSGGTLAVLSAATGEVTREMGASDLGIAEGAPIRRALFFDDEREGLVAFEGGRLVGFGSPGIESCGGVLAFSEIAELRLLPLDAARGWSRVLVRQAIGSSVVMEESCDDEPWPGDPLPPVGPALPSLSRRGSFTLEGSGLAGASILSDEGIRVPFVLDVSVSPGQRLAGVVDWWLVIDGPGEVVLREIPEPVEPDEPLAAILRDRTRALTGDRTIAAQLAEDFTELAATGAGEIDVEAELVPSPPGAASDYWRCTWSARQIDREITWHVDLGAIDRDAVPRRIRRESRGKPRGTPDRARVEALHAFLRLPDTMVPECLGVAQVFPPTPPAGRSNVFLEVRPSEEAPLLEASWCSFGAGAEDGEWVWSYHYLFEVSPDGQSVIPGSIDCFMVP